MKTILVNELKDRINVTADFSDFSCHIFGKYMSIRCTDCIFSLPDECGGLTHCFDFAAIFAHDFGDKQEVYIGDLKQFRVR